MTHSYTSIPEPTHYRLKTRQGNPRVTLAQSPDGSLIALSAGDAVGIIDRDGGQRRELFQGGVDQVSWSSDGREVIFLDRSPDGTSAFRAVSLNGGPARTLVLFDDPLLSPRPWFFVHGDRIYYLLGEFEGDIWVMDLIW